MFVADDFGAWLIGLLADRGRKRLTTVFLGTDQQRAIRSAAATAVRRTAEELRPDDDEEAEHVALVISQVFSEPLAGAPLAEHETMLEALQAEIAGQLAVLDDASQTGVGQSSADLLGVPTGTLAQKLTAHLLREIFSRGAQGGPLFPLASQLNDDVTHLQGQRLEDMVGRLTRDLRKAQDDLSRLRLGDLDRAKGARHNFDGLLRDYELFGGRANELGALQAFVNDPGGGYLFVSGASGYGKTALLAQYARLDDVIYHFINRAYGTADEDLCLRNLCQQLAARHQLDEPIPVTPSDRRAHLATLLRLPSPDGRPVVVLLDGLDESLGWEPGPFLFPPELPDGVKVIFSAREVAGAGLADLPTPAGGAGAAAQAGQDDRGRCAFPAPGRWRCGGITG